MSNPPFVHNRFVVVCLPGCIPDFGRFYGSRGSHVVEAALAKNLPHRSRENEFTDGRVKICILKKFQCRCEAALSLSLFTSSE